MTPFERMLDALPVNCAGPGGAAAVLRHGRVLEARWWGWADTERRIAFTPRTLFRICSITKQFTCAAAFDALGDLAVLDDDVRRALPGVPEPPRTAHLAHNQSGLRDYWAVAMLCGAPAESAFGPAEAARIIALCGTHFAPGTRYSYANQNFRLLGEAAARRAGRPFDDLLRSVWDRAGMTRALLAADTAAMPDGTVGYEGSVDSGFRPAVNRIVWTGDAGMGACLDDMIAWEAFIDATRDDADGLYRRLCAPVAFADGSPALYGFGLGRGRLHGREITGHGGGLRGWRSYRLHCAAERVSVVVLFNHMADAREAAAGLFGALLGAAAQESDGIVDPAWAGAYLEPETGLAVRLEPAGARVRLLYGTVPEMVDPQAVDSADGGARLSRDAGGVTMQRPGEHLSCRLVPLAGEVRRDIEGVFVSPELRSELTVISTGGAPYAAFSGFLGTGEMQMLRPVGGDVWRLPCARALDYHPPGDWTLAFRRNSAGQVSGAQVGCWLARGIDYTR